MADLQGVRLVRGVSMPGVPAHTGIVEVECRQLELLTCGQGRQPASGCGDEARARGDEHGDERGKHRSRVANAARRSLTSSWLLPGRSP